MYIMSSLLNSHLLVIVVFIFSKFEEVTAIVSPSSIENVCPGEKISLVCSVNAESLTWLVPDPTEVRLNLDRSFIRSLSENIVGERSIVPGDTLGAYAVTLNTVTPNLCSTLEVTLYRSMDGRNIVCSGVMVFIDLYDPPAPAINIRITSSLNNTEENIAIVSLEWDYFSDGSPVNYSVTVIGSSENDTVSALTAEMRVELKLRYNTEYAVIVEVINCAVSSSSSMFTFELVRCEVPTFTTNGMFESTGQAEGETLTLTCNEGFTSTGPISATCTQFALWQPNLEVSHCVSHSIECPPLEAPPNGRFIDYEYTNRTSLTGTVVTYHCDRGLFPNDIKSTTCREDGTWSNIPPELTCREEPIRCKISNKPDYYESYNSSLQEGSAVITFKCDYGFFLVGEVISICINSEHELLFPPVLKILPRGFL
ncbi:CUB and sushi domain-containing protein 1-like [Halichondria panicea]|uniref:CUB and sushi domain-containing protein 1-like n=1 Tax=Halichondria panicea TaxID=6063 RepID=UPI00312BA3D6